MTSYAFTATRFTAVELNARAVKDLNYDPVEIIPAPGAGRCIIVRDVICRKGGTRGIAAANSAVHFALAFTDVTDHELAVTPDDDAVLSSAIFVRTLPQVFPRGNHGRHILPGPDYPIGANLPLKAIAIGEEADWIAATQTLQAVTLSLVVRYETMEVT